MKAASLAACSIMLVVACSHGSDRGESGPDTRPAPTPAPHVDPVDPATLPAVVLTSATGEERRVVVEVVSTPRARSRGLMYRQHLPPDRGMLFIFETEEIQSFWMKNTLIPLDMIFIGKDMTIAGIVENAEPRTLTSRRVDKPSMYVLEVNGGWSKQNGVGAGNAVRFENVKQ